jgi:hypothetical protein
VSNDANRPSRAEDSEILRGGGGPGPGWNDPDSTAIGSVSRAVGHETIGRQGQSEVTRRTREWSFVTLDHPTFETRSGSGALWDRVIMPLVDLEKGRDDVYGWLELVFQFCEGKPFVYYSQYVPSARIYGAGAVAQGAPAMVPARPAVRHTPRGPSLLAPALAERQSVAGAACAPLGARGKSSRSAKGARRGGAPSGGPASA